MTEADAVTLSQMSYDSLSSPNVLRANPMIGGDQQLTPNSSMDESSLFLDTSEQFINEHKEMLCFTGGGGDSSSSCSSAVDTDAEMKDQQGEEEERFFRNIVY